MSLASVPGVDSLLSGSYTLFKTQNNRIFEKFGQKGSGFAAPCNVIERHTDTYVYTEHPVAIPTVVTSGQPAIGALTDHAYRLAKRVDIELSYSISGGINAIKALGSLLGKSNKPTTINDYYQYFVTLQSTVTPFQIVTGKRHYNNMVIEEMQEVTDYETENILKLTMRCREIIICLSSPLNTKTSDNATFSPPSQQGSNTAESLPQSNVPVPNL